MTVIIPWYLLFSFALTYFIMVSQKLLVFYCKSLVHFKNLVFSISFYHNIMACDQLWLKKLPTGHDVCPLSAGVIG
jgi:hypothetical protein